MTVEILQGLFDPSIISNAQVASCLGNAGPGTFTMNGIETAYRQLAENLRFHYRKDPIMKVTGETHRQYHDRIDGEVARVLSPLANIDYLRANYGPTRQSSQEDMELDDEEDFEDDDDEHGEEEEEEQSDGQAQGQQSGQE